MYHIDQNILLDKEFIDYYLNQISNAETINSITSSNQDPFNKKYDNLYNLNTEALITSYYNDLSINSIEQIGNIVNEDSKYINNGLRKMNNKDLNLPDSKHIKEDLSILLDMYNTSEDDIFIKEALLHIGLIRYQILEDGNHRTAKFILDTNLLKQGIAPSIITPSNYPQYLKSLKDCNVQMLANILKEASIIENEYLNKTYITYKQDKRSRI